jgi:hypothetical protein
MAIVEPGLVEADCVLFAGAGVAAVVGVEIDDEPERVVGVGMPVGVVVYIDIHRPTAKIATTIAIEKMSCFECCVILNIIYHKYRNVNYLTP